MSKRFKFFAGIASVTAFSIAAYYFSKRKAQLDVTGFEEALLFKFPNAKITGIEKTFANDDVYAVTLILDGAEKQLYVTADGEIIEEGIQTQTTDGE